MNEKILLERMACHCRKQGFSDQTTDNAVKSARIFCQKARNMKGFGKVPYYIAICYVMTMYLEKNLYNPEPVDFELARELYNAEFNKTCSVEHIQKQSGLFFRESFYPFFCLKTPVSQSKVKEVLDEIILHNGDCPRRNLESLDELLYNSVEALEPFIIRLKTEHYSIEKQTLERFQNMLETILSELITRVVQEEKYAPEAKERIKQDGRAASETVNRLVETNKKIESTET